MSNAAVTGNRNSFKLLICLIFFPIYLPLLRLLQNTGNTRVVSVHALKRQAEHTHTRYELSRVENAATCETRNGHA